MSMMMLMMTLGCAFVISKQVYCEEVDLQAKGQTVITAS